MCICDWPFESRITNNPYKDVCAFRRIQEDTGFTAVSLQYPSTRQPINKLAAGVAEEVKDLVLHGGHEGVWAVTHSLGGIVQRHIMGLPDQGGISWKGIVMIAPPKLSGLPGIGESWSKGTVNVVRSGCRTTAQILALI
ncbi:hypothetical protein WJX77_009293 [Trebouxia sp. C0004]